MVVSYKYAAQHEPVRHLPTGDVSGVAGGGWSCCTARAGEVASGAKRRAQGQHREVYTEGLRFWLILMASRLLSWAIFWEVFGTRFGLRCSEDLHEPVLWDLPTGYGSAKGHDALQWANLAKPDGWLRVPFAKVIPNGVLMFNFFYSFIKSCQLRDALNVEIDVLGKCNLKGTVPCSVESWPYVWPQISHYMAVGCISARETRLKPRIVQCLEQLQLSIAIIIIFSTPQKLWRNLVPQFWSRKSLPVQKSPGTLMAWHIDCFGVNFTDWMPSGATSLQKYSKISKSKIKVKDCSRQSGKATLQNNN